MHSNTRIQSAPISHLSRFFGIPWALAFSMLSACSGSKSTSDTGDKQESLAPKSPQHAENQAPPAGLTPNAKFDGPGALLQKKIGDFAIASDPRYFGPDNLYDLINGGAEIYRDYGLKKMVTADYRSSSRDDLSVTVEIYDQGSLLGAFGRTARFLVERANPENAGKGLPKDLENQGIFGGTDIVFYKDKYLVHITLLDENPTATLESMEETGKKILPDFIASVSGQIPSNPPLPGELSAFPGEHKVARSEIFEPKDLAGIVGLGAGFACRYKHQDKRFLLFFTEPQKDTKAVLKTLEGTNRERLDAGKLAFQASKNRITGFLAETVEWSKADAKLAQNTLDAMKRSITR